MIQAYKNMRDLLDSATKVNGTRRKPKELKKYDLVDRRFSWMYEHSNHACENPTNPFFETDEWTIPAIEASNICASFVSMMESTMSFFDHNVCLDKIDLKENRKAHRRFERIESDFRRSKKVFNRIMRGLKCSERLSLN